MGYFRDLVKYFVDLKKYLNLDKYVVLHTKEKSIHLEVDNLNGCIIFN